MRLAHGEALPEEPLGFLVLRLIDSQAAERHEAPGYLGIVGPEERATLVERGAEQRIRPVELAELLVDASQRLTQLGLHRGVPIQTLGLLHTPVEQRHDAQAVRRADGLVAALEQVQHEALDALGPSCLGEGSVPGRRERSEEHTSELQSLAYLVCRLLLEKKNKI